MDVHEAVADAIRAARFTAMAQEYLDRPDLRPKVIQAMTRNIANDRHLGPNKARTFARLASLAAGIPKQRADFR